MACAGLAWRLVRSPSCGVWRGARDGGGCRSGRGFGLSTLLSAGLRLLPVSALLLGHVLTSPSPLRSESTKRALKMKLTHLLRPIHLSVLAAGLISASLALPATAQEKKPNILVIWG